MLKKAIEVIEKHRANRDEARKKEWNLIMIKINEEIKNLLDETFQRLFWAVSDQEIEYGMWDRQFRPWAFIHHNNHGMLVTHLNSGVQYDYNMKISPLPGISNPTADTVYTLMHLLKDFCRYIRDNKRECQIWHRFKVKSSTRFLISDTTTSKGSFTKVVKSAKSVKVKWSAETYKAKCGTSMPNHGLADPPMAHHGLEPSWNIGEEAMQMRIEESPLWQRPKETDYHWTRPPKRQNINEHYHKGGAPRTFGFIVYAQAFTLVNLIRFKLLLFWS